MANCLSTKIILRFLRFTPYLVIINKNKANIQARLARHAKLNASVSSHHTSPLITPKKSLFGRFAWGSGKATPLKSEKGSVHKFVKRVASVTAAFFIVSSVSSFDYYFQSTAVQGYEGTDASGYEGETVQDVTAQEVPEIVDYVVEEDGFLLKPNLDIEAGDRTTESDILSYHVEEGDTLASIAEHFGIKQETIMMNNGMWEASQLKPGMNIQIIPVDGVSHVVQKGETISEIASKYKVSSEDIIRQNQLEEGESIVPDMTLIIPGGTRVVEPPKPKPTYVATTSSRSNSGGNVPAASVPTGPSYSNYEYTGPTATGSFIHPAPNGCIITQGFHGGHYAVDCAKRSGGPIVAAESGVVIKANSGNYGGGYGNYTIVQHADGSTTLYAHFKELYVSVGQTVNQGDPLGAMGTTGFSTGVHLHFEYRTAGGVKLSPYTIINW